ncbi:MAG: leucyl/phenylalanyl-tRNA--protein transferase [Rhodospirillaceae bacterium]|jgi:leucyl/phenylalanyl-tRNA---protein transferase|nr:leucyl/phenylalanyl-tRNA--protein transferase [Rhodospirillaceae bacterium]MBT4487120.1 leucyl/phenylalanyl-tRNA--protein transferase [Rhodospirillaceae bacterium]MBT5195867.1 leucyl/phenylalanyl-tRNA--protein transferase [Rhodospirillaceae bacterium]MBT5896056.1 leucyl/phenylalanyl-tRNA--protein transferase [Rhodospirillaceae bacterium]MBT6426071.1 leucyl/phenylalanyl-tRNA--protein transferase [Rhodospirillaceae bacterium]
MKITPDIVLKAYAAGIFPMSEGRDDPEMFWVDPEQRGILPLDSFHLPRRLARTVRREPYEIRIDSAFAAVMTACATPAAGRWTTWINDEIQQLFTELHRRGHAHSIETWADGELAGGLYGIALGGAFFGESMFSRRTDASKVALVHLVARLLAGGFVLLDTQFITDHLRQFGAMEISREAYHSRLASALGVAGDFKLSGKSLSASAVLQSITHTS